MPSETRVLTFADPEVIAALITYARRTGNLMINGPVQGISYEEKHEVQAFLAMGGRRVVRVDRADLTAALIFYCLVRKVPLPSGAGKALNIRSGELELVLDIRNPLADRKDRVVRL
jgi:hypothetical protein